MTFFLPGNGDLKERLRKNKGLKIGGSLGSGKVLGAKSAYKTLQLTPKAADVRQVICLLPLTLLFSSCCFF